MNMCNTSVDFDKFMVQQLHNNFIGKSLQIQGLIVVDIHEFNPKDFFPPGLSTSQIKECYVLTPRRPLFIRKSPGCQTSTVYWKELGYIDGKINCLDGVIGQKQTLCFYEGDKRNGQKTKWKMTEYSVQHHTCSDACNHNHIRWDDLVLCKVYEDLKPDSLYSMIKDMRISH